MRRFLFILAFTLSIPWSLVHAQTTSIGLSISTNPINPKPLESINLSVSSFDTNLNQATITWSYNGRVVESGIGSTRTTVTAPAAGSSATITVSVAAGAASGSTSIQLQPGNVDLLWEAVTSYTPPFYKGKALPAVNATIRVTAIPTANSPKQQNFTWTQNGSAQQDSSGYNKSSFVYINKELNQRDIIGVQTGGGLFSGSNTTTITPRPASLVAYQKDEGFIDYAHGSTNAVNITGPGAVLIFEPYYFSVPKNIETNLNFALSVDGEGLGTLVPPNELRLTRPENGGISSLEVIVHTAAYSLQNLTRTFRLIFN